MNEDEMAMPCECPKCGGIHELASARKCDSCGGMFCTRCMDTQLYKTCINCADEMEDDTL